MRNLYFLISIMFISVLFYQCRKNINLNNSSTENESSDYQVGFRSAEDPTESNGAYKFNDTTHFFDYYSYLDTILSTDDSLFEETVLDPTSFNTVYRKLLNRSFSNPANRYQPFLTDPVMRAIVNENFELQIGNTLVTYINNETVIVSDPSDNTSRSQLRALTKGVEIDTSDIPENTYWAYDGRKKPFKIDFSWCGCWIDMKIQDCNTATIYGACKNLVFGDGKGTVEICTTYDASCITDERCRMYDIDGNFSFDIPLSDFCDVTSIYTIARSECGFNSRIIDQPIDPQQTYCDREEKSVWDWKENGNEALEYETSWYKNFFKTALHKAEAWSYKWDSNNNEWDRDYAILDVEIDATSEHRSCTSNNREVKSKNKHRDHLTVRENVIGFWPPNPEPWHCDGDVIGNYKKTEHSNVIDESHQIDFDCCQ